MRSDRTALILAVLVAVIGLVGLCSGAPVAITAAQLFDLSAAAGPGSFTPGSGQLPLPVDLAYDLVSLDLCCKAPPRT